MPGSVQAASPTLVMPCRVGGMFTERHEYVVESCGPYVDGRVQSKVMSPTNPRRSWTIGQRLWTDFTPSPDVDYTQDLIDFYLDVQGPLVAFYFYPTPSQHDPTGASVTGRYTVRFDGPFSATVEIANLHNAQFSLVEVV